jgi:threonine dehydrogenase-like Zn-dependent dehydrogenase
MRALVIEDIYRNDLREVPEPNMQVDEVLISVRHVGLCGSDLATFTGLNPHVSLPRIPGHEIGGVIVAKGADVADAYQPGRRVTILPYTSCGECTSCRKGRVNACRYNRTLGVQQDGGLADMIALPAAKVIVNETLPPRQLSLVEPLSVGFHAARRGRISPGDQVAVIGCGMIGMGVILAAVDIGAEVTAIDVSDRKLEIAHKLGVAHVINAGREAAGARFDQITAGNGADVVVEAVAR